jgi:hypothetical protein
MTWERQKRGQGPRPMTGTPLHRTTPAAAEARSVSAMRARIFMQRDAPSPRRTEVSGIVLDAGRRLIGAAFVPLEQVRAPACEYRLPGGVAARPSSPAAG